MSNITSLYYNLINFNRLFCTSTFVHVCLEKLILQRIFYYIIFLILIFSIFFIYAILTIEFLLNYSKKESINLYSVIQLISNSCLKTSISRNVFHHFPSNAFHQAKAITSSGNVTINRSIWRIWTPCNTTINHFAHLRYSFLLQKNLSVTFRDRSSRLIYAPFHRSAAILKMLRPYGSFFDIVAVFLVSFSVSIVCRFRFGRFMTDWNYGGLRNWVNDNEIRKLLDDGGSNCSLNDGKFGRWMIPLWLYRVVH